MSTATPPSGEYDSRSNRLDGSESGRDGNGGGGETDYKRRAEDLFDELFGDKGLCPVCFARKRTYYPEYDAALANRLYRGPKNGHRGSNKVAFASMGHSLNTDGSLQVNSATSDADPATYQDVVPETWIDGEWHPSRARTICQCGVIDYDYDEARSKGQMYDAIENIGEHLREDGYDFDDEAAEELLRQALRSDKLAGRDRDVLVSAMTLGLRHGDEDGDDDDDQP